MLCKYIFCFFFSVSCQAEDPHTGIYNLIQENQTTKINLIFLREKLKFSQSSAQIKCTAYYGAKWSKNVLKSFMFSINVKYYVVEYTAKQKKIILEKLFL